MTSVQSTCCVANHLKNIEKIVKELTINYLEENQSYMRERKQVTKVND